MHTIDVCFNLQEISTDFQIEDVSGKKLSALIVFARSIEFFKDYLLTLMNNHLADTIFADEIGWVITVPAIWNDSSKKLMRLAAEQVIYFYSVFRRVS